MRSPFSIVIVKQVIAFSLLTSATVSGTLIITVRLKALKITRHCEQKLFLLFSYFFQIFFPDFFLATKGKSKVPPKLSEEY